MANPKLVSSNEVKIDKDIPEPKQRGKYETKFPWAHMEVGDSFYVEGSSAYAHATRATKVHAPKRFKAHRWGQSSIGFRIWRIA